MSWNLGDPDLPPRGGGGIEEVRRESKRDGRDGR